MKYRCKFSTVSRATVVWLLVPLIVLNAQITKRPIPTFRPTMCSQSCRTQINAATEYARKLFQEEKDKTKKLQQRLGNLDSEYRASSLSLGKAATQVSNLNSRLSMNMSILNNNLQDEMRAVLDLVLRETDDVRKELNRKLKAVRELLRSIPTVRPTAPPLGYIGAVGELYWNLTGRLDRLDSERINNLTMDYKLWRRNFDIVDRTTARIKYNGDCRCR